MRPPLLGDAVAAARALLAAPGRDRDAILADLLSQAEEADRHRRGTGRSHPLWGDGSLMAAAMTRPRAAEPALDDAEYCLCLAAVLLALARRGGTSRGPLSS